MNFEFTKSDTLQTKKNKRAAAQTQAKLLKMGKSEQFILQCLTFNFPNLFEA